MNITKDQVKSAIKDSLFQQGKISTKTSIVSWDDNFRPVYLLDELDLVEMTLRIEQLLKIKLNDKYIYELKTLAQLKNYVYRMCIIQHRMSNE